MVRVELPVLHLPRQRSMVHQLVRLALLYCWRRLSKTVPWRQGPSFPAPDHQGRVWLVRTRTGFTRTVRLVGTAPVLGRPEHVLLAPASRPEQTEQFHFFTVKPGGNIDFVPK